MAASALDGRRRLILAGAACAAVGLWCQFSRSPTISRHAAQFSVVEAVAFSLAFLLGIACLMAWWQQRHRGQFELNISPEGVRRRGSLQRELFLQRSEIVGMRETRSGIVLLTADADPRRSILIPRDLDGFEQARAELISLKVPESAARGGTRLRWVTLLIAASAMVPYLLPHRYSPATRGDWLLACTMAGLAWEQGVIPLLRRRRLRRPKTT